MCQNCDATHHSVAFQHRKRVISCYVGCPAAKDLAALWGFNLNKFNHSNGAPVVTKSVSSLASEMDNMMMSVLCTESQQGSTSFATKQEGSYLILQQIQELERLQLSEGLDDSSLLHMKERTSGAAFRHVQMEQFGGQIDLQNNGNSVKAKTEEPLSSPFSQLDNLTSTGNLLQGDAYWQCKSPVHNNEIWLQNMQDLGVCDEVKWMDDDNIPDVDLTFRNFEELFGNEHELGRGLADDMNMACSFVDKHPTFAEFDRGCASSAEEIPGSSPADTPGQARAMQMGSYPTRPSYSTSSFSLSRATGESSGSECKDDGVSPSFPQPLQHISETTKLDGKGNVMMRHKEKKSLRNEKQAGQLRFPRSKSDLKKRGRANSMKAESSSGNITRSF